MSTLIVIAHPDPSSLTHAVASRLASTLSAAGEAVEFADLAAEGFDPRFTLADRRSYVVAGEYPGDVVAEMARIDRAARPERRKAVFRASVRPRFPRRTSPSQPPERRL